MSKVGRNEPCPCGSGKKYKFCHGDPLNLPFPEDQTFMESIGKPNGATDVLKQLKGAMGDQDFETMAEAEAFMNQFMSSHNNSAREDFLGLSSTQIGDILNNPVDECPSIVKLNWSVLDKPSPTQVPILEGSRWLLSKLESAPIKLTSAGYLPPLIAVPWWEESLGPVNFYGDLPLVDPVKKEGDRLLLGEFRKIMVDLGWMKVRTGTLSITKKGSQFLSSSFRDQYKEAYLGVTEALNWDLIDNPYFAPFHPMMKDSWLFNLHILKRAGEKGVLCDDAAELWLKAFPLVLEDYSLASDGLEKTRHDGVKRTVSTNCFSYFPRLLGLTDILKDESKWYSPKAVRLSEMAKSIHRWMV